MQNLFILLVRLSNSEQFGRIGAFFFLLAGIAFLAILSVVLFDDGKNKK